MKTSDPLTALKNPPHSWQDYGSLLATILFYHPQSTYETAKKEQWDAELWVQDSTGKKKKEKK